MSFCMDPEARPITFGVEVRDAEPAQRRRDNWAFRSALLI